MREKLLLKYYLDTEDYFRSSVFDFLEVFEHYGKCGKGYEFCFDSEVSVRIKEKYYADEGYRFVTTPKNLYKYFDDDYSEEQRFAVVFAYWYGLSEKNCQIVGDKRRKKLAWSILNAFFCEKTTEEVSSLLANKKLSLQEKMRYLDEPCRNYVISAGQEKIKVTRVGDTLISKNDGTEYAMKLIGT